MTKLKIILLLCLILIGKSLFAEQLKFDKQFKVEVAKQTSAYYKQWGIKRSYTKFIPFITSSVKVSKIFPTYLDGLSQKERILSLYCMGASESYLKRNYVNVNVPGYHYASGKVRFFSLDYGWAGLNDDEVDNTYRIAKILQDKRGFKFSRLHPSPLWFPNRQFINDMDGVVIPNNINLYKISLKQSADARTLYRQYKKEKKSPVEIYRLIKPTVSFSESGQDQLDSLLIYRTLVEIDRADRGWSYNNRDKELYKWLLKTVK